MIASLEINGNFISIHILIATITLFTTFAYWHASKELRKKYVKDIFLEYYSRTSKGRGEYIYYGMIGFEAISTTYSFIISMAMGILALISLCFQESVLIKIMIPIGSMVSLVFWAWVLDLNEWFCKDKWNTLANREEEGDWEEEDFSYSFFKSLKLIWSKGW